MDAMLTRKAEELALEMATQATTLDELNGLMRSLMKTALEHKLNTELNVHLGRMSEGVAATLVEAREEVPPESGSDGPSPRNRKNGFSPKTIQRRFPRSRN